MTPCWIPGGGWRLPYTSPLGDVYTVAATMRADVYSFNGFDPHDPDNIDPVNGKSDVVGRFFPQISAEWRYPFAREHDGWQEVIEPIAQAVDRAGLTRDLLARPGIECPTITGLRSRWPQIAALRARVSSHRERCCGRCERLRSSGGDPP